MPVPGRWLSCLIVSVLCGSHCFLDESPVVLTLAASLILRKFNPRRAYLVAWINGSVTGSPSQICVTLKVPYTQTPSSTICNNKSFATFIYFWECIFFFGNHKGYSIFAYFKNTTYIYIYGILNLESFLWDYPWKRRIGLICFWNK